eukprot:529151_1
MESTQWQSSSDNPNQYTAVELYVDEFYDSLKQEILTIANNSKQFEGKIYETPAHMQDSSDSIQLSRKIKLRDINQQNTHIYHKPFIYSNEFYKMKRIKRDSYCSFGYFISLLIITSGIFYAAFTVFDTAASMKEYMKSFTIRGECMVIDQNGYKEKDRRRLQSMEPPESHEDDGYVYVHEYKFTIINHTSCTQNDIYTYKHFMESGTESTPYKYSINEIVICYTNEYCEHISLDSNEYYKINKHLYGWVIFGGVIVCLIGLCCCVMAVFRCSYTMELHDESRVDILKKKYNNRQWKQMKENQRFDYFINHYSKKYKLNLCHQVNDVIKTYYYLSDH